MSSPRAEPNLRERDLIKQAKRGDQTAFEQLVEPHRAQLIAHCYRMLGSVQDAEDAMQETMLRAWRGLARFDPHRPMRPWLYRIATNNCLDLLGKRPRRVLPIDHGPPTDPAAGEGMPVVEPIWIEPYPDERLGVADGYASPQCRYEERESIELAFIAALQHLPPRQRATLVLRDVLGFSAAEVADVLQTTRAAANSALQRARATLTERLPDRSQQATLRALGDSRLHDLVKRFIDAFEGGDIDAIVSLLTRDVTCEMPPYVEWTQGRAAVAHSWLMPAGPPPRLRYVALTVNGQAAVAAYLLDAAATAYVPLCIDVLTIRGRSIGGIVVYRMPEMFPTFGLPDAIPA